MDQLKHLEISVHQRDVRTNKDKLTELLHPEFIEIGYSGKTYQFADILELLLTESPPDFEVLSQDYDFYEYAPNIVQLIYRSARLNSDGVLSNHAKRTSIWVNESGKWQIKFHQATPTFMFEKSPT